MRRLSLFVVGSLLSGFTLAEGPDVTSCPDAFHGIKLHDDAKLCQIFDSGSPASMVYHVTESPRKAIDFVLQDGRLAVKSNVHQRTLIMSSDRNHRIIVSPDGTGSQIDILIIKPNEVSDS